MEKVAIITGATRGLGFELGKQLIEKNFYLIGLYKSNKEAVILATNKLENISSKFSLFSLDDQELNSFITQKLTKHTEVVFINNGWSSFNPTPFHLLNSTQFKEQFEPLFDHFNLLQNSIRSILKCDRKLLINILTEGMVTPKSPKGFSSYLSSKFALLGLMNVLESEYGERGLKIKNFYPGFMSTDFTKDWNENFFANSKIETPNDIAKQVIDYIAVS